MEQNPSSSYKVTDRKTREKNRRKHMKDLYSELHALVPHHSSREVKPVTDQLHEAANYIKKLTLKLEKMKEKRESLMRNENPKSRFNGAVQIDIHEAAGCALLINMTTNLDLSSSMFDQIIRILHEEGLDILSANFSVNGTRVFHIIHAKVGDYAPGCGSATVSERIKKFVNGS